jgi:hypothetical protein
MLKAGKIAPMPMDMVHDTYNPNPRPRMLPAIDSPANTQGTPLVDVSREAP